MTAAQLMMLGLAAYYPNMEQIMAMLKKKPKPAATKKKVIKVDFEGVERGFSRVPEGAYKVKPTGWKLEDGDAAQYIAWTLEITDGSHKGKKLGVNTSLSPKALWNLRGLLEAMDQEVPDGVMEIDGDAIVEAEPEFGVLVEHETYEGKKRNRVVDYMSADDVDDSGEGGGGDEGKSDEITEEDIMAMDEDELEALVKENELDVDLNDYANIKSKRKAVIAAAQGGGDEDEEKDKKKPGKKKKDKLTVEDVEALDLEELGALVEEHSLDVDLDGVKVEKGRRLVIAALKKADVIEEE